MSIGSSGLEEAVADGDVVPWPAEIAVDDHPGASGPIAYLAAEPLMLGAPDGTARTLAAGDVLHADEARHAGTALARMLRHHQIIAVPSDRGVVGLVGALLAKVDRLEERLAAGSAQGSGT